MFTAISYACVGRTPVEWKQKEIIGYKPRLIHKIALIVDCIIGLLILALGCGAGPLKLGLSSNIRFAIIGVGGTYSFAMLIFTALRLKHRYCPNAYMIKPPQPENALKQSIDELFFNQ